MAKTTKKPAAAAAPTPSKKKLALHYAAIAGINAALGKAKAGVQANVGSALHRSEITQVIPTGIEALDRFALGIGGIGGGRVVEVFGPKSSGKTTLAYTTIANAQKLGWLVVYCETENAYEKARAESLGVDTSTLIVVQPERTEDVARVIVETLKSVRAVDKGTPILLVWDSLAATSTKREMEGDIGDAQMADKARLLNQVVRVVSHALTRLNAAWLIINQTREKIGVMFGSPETTPGGNAIRFQATHQVRVSAGKVLTKDGQPIGMEVKFKVVKNKVAPPQREVMAHLIYDKGWDETWNTINHAKEVKAVPDATQVTERGYAAARKALKWDAAAVALDHLTGDET